MSHEKTIHDGKKGNPLKSLKEKRAERKAKRAEKKAKDGEMKHHRKPRLKFKTKKNES